MQLSKENSSKIKNAGTVYIHARITAHDMCWAAISKTEAKRLVRTYGLESSTELRVDGEDLYIDFVS